MNLPTHIKLIVAAGSIATLIIAPEIAIQMIEHIVVGLFEVLEGVLDEIIEHLFHTDRHTTQMIVFYLMWALFIYAAYRLQRYARTRIQIIKAKFPSWWAQQSEQLNAHWQNQPLGKKIQWVSGCFIGSLCFSYLIL